MIKVSQHIGNVINPYGTFELDRNQRLLLNVA
jgi:hypothetical protein